MTKSSLKLAIFLLLLPALLTVLGISQFMRLTNLTQDRATLSAQIASLSELAQRDPHAAIPSGVPGRVLGVQYAGQILKAQLSDLDENQPAIRARQALPFWTVACGLLATLLGMVGMVLMIRAGRLARHSREQLWQIFSKGYQRLPWLMGAMTVLLASATITASIYETLASIHITSAMSNGDLKRSVLFGIISLVAIAAALQALYALYVNRTSFNIQPMPLMGRSVSTTQSPALWAWMRDIAQRLNALPPDHIVVGLCDGFFVTSSDIRLTPSEAILRGRTLYLPLTYLAVLSRSETEVIMGHELAHFAGADTEYSTRFVPIFSGVYRNLRHMHTLRERDIVSQVMLYPTFLLGEFFSQQFDHAVQHWSRQRELMADKLGSSLHSPVDAATALLRTRLFNLYIHESLGRVRLQPKDQDDLVAEMITSAQARGLDNPQTHLDDEWAHPTDSHPTLRQRMDALQVNPNADLLTHAARPVDDAGMSLLNQLLGGGRAWCQQLTKDLSQVQKQDIDIRTGLLTDQWIIKKPPSTAMLVFGLMAFLQFLFAFGIVLMFTSSGTHFKMITVTVIAFLMAGGAACTFVANIYRKKSQKPFIVVRRDSLRLEGMSGELAWSAVESVVAHPGFVVTLQLQLMPGTTLPPPGKKATYLRFDTLSNQLFITLPRISGKDYDEIATLFYEYHHIAHAGRVDAGPG
ncbi:M48 family metalloprotease [Undibacterium sp. TJN19]|uniref:M48 family metalloprotease n=1 Tax=Undibacterium sp. TJN19 TaxID=3413055 RepID=UPI003BF1E2FB